MSVTDVTVAAIAVTVIKNRDMARVAGTAKLPLDRGARFLVTGRMRTSAVAMPSPALSSGGQGTDRGPHRRQTGTYRSAQKVLYVDDVHRPA